MSFAYLPLYTADYLRDTRALSPMEHGIYLLLLMTYWDSRNPLPLNAEKLAMLAGARSKEEMAALSHVLEAFFVRLEDGYYQVRMDREIARANALSRKRSDAGKAGKDASVRRRKALNAKAIQASAKQVSALAEQVPLSLSLSPSPGRTKRNGTNAARFVPPTIEQLEAYIAERRYSVNARRFLDHYQANGWKVGRNPMKDWQAAVRTWAAKAKDSQPQAGRLAI